MSDDYQFEGDGRFGDDSGPGDEPGPGDDAGDAPWEVRNPGGQLRAVGEVLGAILLAVIAAGALVLGAGLVVFLSSPTEPGTVTLLLVSLVGSQAGFALVALGYMRWRDESVRAIGLSMPDFTGWILVPVGVVAALVLALSAGAAVQSLGLQAAENTTATTAAEVPSSFLLLIPVAILVVGPCEELLFRGVVQRRLREVASAPTAIVAASALFAAVHVIALSGGLAARATTIAILFVPAMVFGVLYEYTENVVVTSLVHGLYDAVLFGAAYVAFTYAPEAAQESTSVVALLASIV